MTFLCNYKFEELRLIDRKGAAAFGDGMLLFGEAELESDGERGSFYVKAIQVGDVWLSRNRDTFEGQLFLRICEALYADADVARFYCDAEEAGTERPGRRSNVYSTLNHGTQGISAPATRLPASSIAAGGMA